MPGTVLNTLYMDYLITHLILTTSSRRMYYPHFYRCVLQSWLFHYVTGKVCMNHNFLRPPAFPIVLWTPAGGDRVHLGVRHIRALDMQLVKESMLGEKAELCRKKRNKIAIYLFFFHSGWWEDFKEGHFIIKKVRKLNYVKNGPLKFLTAQKKKHPQKKKKTTYQCKE